MTARAGRCTPEKGSSMEQARFRVGGLIGLERGIARAEPRAGTVTDLRLRRERGGSWRCHRSWRASLLDASLMQAPSQPSITPAIPTETNKKDTFHQQPPCPLSVLKSPTTRNMHVPTARSHCHNPHYAPERSESCVPRQGSVPCGHASSSWCQPDGSKVLHTWVQRDKPRHTAH